MKLSKAPAGAVDLYPEVLDDYDEDYFADVEQVSFIKIAKSNP